RADVSVLLVFSGGGRTGDGVESGSFRVLLCQMTEPADPEDGHALVRLGIGPAEPAIDCVTGAEDRGCLLVGNLVGNQISGISIHQHVLRVTALYIETRALQIRTEHQATALAP